MCTGAGGRGEWEGTQGRITELLLCSLSSLAGGFGDELAQTGHPIAVSSAFLSHTTADLTWRGCVQSGTGIKAPKLRVGADSTVSSE